MSDDRTSYVPRPDQRSVVSYNYTTMAMEEEGDDEYYTVPLTDQAVFGAGLKRKRVPFVAASTTTVNSQIPIPTLASSKYLSIVLPEAQNTPSLSAVSASAQESEPQIPKCEICSLPLPTSRDAAAMGDEEEPATLHTPAPHTATLVHQVCLTHSHPPSHLDRTRKGLKYLSSYGWDPDARVGLGREGGEGRLAPVRAKEKNDTLGLGVKLKKGLGKPQEITKVQLLDAKAVRKKGLVDRRKEERLRRMMWGKEDVEKYLEHD